MFSYKIYIRNSITANSIQTVQECIATQCANNFQYSIKINGNIKIIILMHYSYIVPVPVKGKCPNLGMKHVNLKSQIININTLHMLH